MKPSDVIITREMLKATVQKLEEHSIPPCKCRVCGCEFYVIVDGATRDLSRVGLSCDSCLQVAFWNEARVIDGHPRYTRLHPKFGWIFTPSTYPKRATDPGGERFCIGSGERFRDHKYQGGKCVYCPRMRVFT